MPYPFYQRRRDGAPAPFGFVPLSDLTYRPEVDEDTAPVINANAAVIARASRAAPRILQELAKRLAEGKEWAKSVYTMATSPDWQGTRTFDPMKDKKCVREYRDAHNYCLPLMIGEKGFTDTQWHSMEDCLRGNVSERCRGIPYERPGPAPRPYPLNDDQR
ncbi:hypothetical protein [Bradyrhizobium sp. WD16]|uniref:hypothetical protein n=1 Tax=Bradyrhizobium sp. WD16 TaxID=1521768 RepID=UPI0020A47106|nr:hypothetical protein [Bradyrhizobium sp. WD16]